MNPVKIFTDSSASLSRELLEKYDISTVSLYVAFENESYKDGIEIDEEKMYKLIEEKDMLPKTAAATPGDFYNAFSPWLEKGYDVVYVGISSYLSSTIQNAQIAARELGQDRVFVVDSMNLSSGIGLLALLAAEYAEEGMDANTIFEKVMATVPKVRSSFVIDTLEFLHKGGRCTSLQKWVTSVFKIHPRIIVQDGKMTVGEKFKGKRAAVLHGLLETVLVNKDKIEPHRIFVTNSMCPDEDIKYLCDGLNKEIDADELLITTAGCVIASHCGKKTIGILYIEKE